LIPKEGPLSESLQPDDVQRPDTGPLPAPDHAPDDPLTDHESPPPAPPQQRLLILDAWQRCGLPAGDFAPLVGLSKHTLYAWKKRFDTHGPAGLLDQPKGARQAHVCPS